MADRNFLYGNSTNADLSRWHTAITESLKATGKMPEELEDLLVAVRSPINNSDGTPRYMIHWVFATAAAGAALSR